jgi:hypothetical protein
MDTKRTVWVIFDQSAQKYFCGVKFDNDEDIWADSIAAAKLYASNQDAESVISFKFTSLSSLITTRAVALSWSVQKFGVIIQ